jgi:hypothetical protein
MTISDFDPRPASSAPARLAIPNRRYVPRFARLVVPVVLATTLAWGNPTSAAPPGGPGDPGPDCAADISGSLTATPASVDRETSSSLTTTLAWSVVVPKGCSAPKLTLGGRTIGTSGQMALGVSKTTTFFLRLARENRDLAHATVTVLGDPGFITVSPGLPVRAEDIAKFNEQWMQPYERR